jgi:hypothetical protein
MTDPPSGRDDESAISRAFSRLGLRRDRHGPTQTNVSSPPQAGRAAVVPLSFATTTPQLPSHITVAVLTPTPETSIYLDASDDAPAPLPNSVISQPDPDGSRLFPTPNPIFVTTHRGDAFIRPDDAFSMPPSGHPSLQSQVLNLRDQLAAAEREFDHTGQSSVQFPRPSFLPETYPDPSNWSLANTTVPEDSPSEAFPPFPLSIIPDGQSSAASLEDCPFANDDVSLDSAVHSSRPVTL